jgi:hypothetical protein
VDVPGGPDSHRQEDEAEGGDRDVADHVEKAPPPRRQARHHQLHYHGGQRGDHAGSGILAILLDEPPPIPGHALAGCPLHLLGAERVQEGLRPPEVSGVEAFREPTVDAGEDASGLIALPLRSEQAGQARGRTQFP